jgi:hypothetical protein
VADAGLGKIALNPMNKGKSGRLDHG